MADYDVIDYFNNIFTWLIFLTSKLEQNASFAYFFLVGSKKYSAIGRWHGES